MVINMQRLSPYVLCLPCPSTRASNHRATRNITIRWCLCCFVHTLVDVCCCLELPIRLNLSLLLFRSLWEFSLIDLLTSNELFVYVNTMWFCLCEYYAVFSFHMTLTKEFGPWCHGCFLCASVSVVISGLNIQNTEWFYRNAVFISRSYVCRTSLDSWFIIHALLKMSTLQCTLVQIDTTILYA